ncbi:hypothetical protein SeLEV6574_g05728 [Synchytrium endobioticum]|uniref:Uncharacterized protein n=1 Tax=Synchytrium endobioticum TaxID=286115 RepID=A0A507CSN8_9FUNG|nr:hypothetical protein SeLEV6574_g05728 [Synchytrium endobioticum]
MPAREKKQTPVHPGSPPRMGMGMDPRHGVEQVDLFAQPCGHAPTHMAKRASASTATTAPHGMDDITAGMRSSSSTVLPLPSVDLFAPPYTSTPHAAPRLFAMPVSAIKGVSSASGPSRPSDNEEDDDDLGFGVAARLAEERAKLGLATPSARAHLVRRDESPIEFGDDDAPIDEIGPLFVPTSSPPAKEDKMEDGATQRTGLGSKSSSRARKSSRPARNCSKKLPRKRAKTSESESEYEEAGKARHKGSTANRKRRRHGGSS